MVQSGSRRSIQNHALLRFESDTMRKRFANNEQIAERMEQRPPEFWREFERCVVARTSEGMWIDTEHPAYSELRAQYAPARAAGASARGVGELNRRRERFAVNLAVCENCPGGHYR